jgi:RNA polymerase sigma-70 factor (ECF subfamily)
MSDTSDTSREDVTPRAREAGRMSAPDLRDWFLANVLPLEASLVRFLRRNWRNDSDIPDLLHETYVRVYDSAQRELPDNAKAFAFATAQNLLTDLVRREKVVPIEAASELDALDVALDEPGPDRKTIARDELRRLQLALDNLPPRAREAIVLRQVEGLTRREVAQRMQITERTVKWHLTEGLRALAKALYGDVRGPQ